MARFSINGKTLRNLIGTRVHHQGHNCTIIEVLDDEPAIVLQCNDPIDVIQPDRFGEPARRVRETHTIPVFGPDGRSLHTEFKELGIPDPRDID